MEKYLKYYVAEERLEKKKKWTLMHCNLSHGIFYLDKKKIKASIFDDTEDLIC